MTTRTPDTPAEQVIAWLHSAAGVLWSLDRIGQSLDYHNDESGAFAELITDFPGSAKARWPEPFKWHDIDRAEPFD